MTTVLCCDRHFYFGTRKDAVATGVAVEMDGIGVRLDLCRTCLDAIKAWQKLVRVAMMDGDIKPATGRDRPLEPPRFLNGPSSA